MGCLWDKYDGQGHNPKPLFGYQSFYNRSIYLTTPMMHAKVMRFYNHGFIWFKLVQVGCK